MSATYFPKKLQGAFSAALLCRLVQTPLAIDSATNQYVKPSDYDLQEFATLINLGLPDQDAESQNMYKMVKLLYHANEEGFRSYVMRRENRSQCLVL